MLTSGECIEMCPGIQIGGECSLSTHSLLSVGVKKEVSEVVKVAMGLPDWSCWTGRYETDPHRDRP